MGCINEQFNAGGVILTCRYISASCVQSQVQVHLSDRRQSNYARENVIFSCDNSFYSKFVRYFIFY